jgi:hypothetical protein
MAASNRGTIMAHDKTHTPYPHGTDDSRKHGHGEPFTQDELAHFQVEDRHAAKAIVGLMSAVFSLGCFGALTIAIIAWGG